MARIRQICFLLSFSIGYKNCLACVLWTYCDQAQGPVIITYITVNITSNWLVTIKLVDSWNKFDHSWTESKFLFAAADVIRPGDTLLIP